jgi:hypothetical protein
MSQVFVVVAYESADYIAVLQVLITAVIITVKENK